MPRPIRYAPKDIFSPELAVEKQIVDVSWQTYLPGYVFTSWDGFSIKCPPLKSTERRDIVENAIHALSVVVPCPEKKAQGMDDGDAFEKIEPVYAEGEIWRYQPMLGLWQPIEKFHVLEMLRLWEGRALVERPIKLKKGEKAPDPTIEIVETGNIRQQEDGSWAKETKEVVIPPKMTELVPLSCGKKGIPASVAEGVLQAIQSRTNCEYFVPKGGSFFAEATKGMMFSDYFLFYDEEGRTIERGAKSHRWRQRVAFPFAAPELSPTDDGTLVVPDHPRFRNYLSSIWSKCQDAREREAQLAEFLGVALLGFSTTEPFNKITFLHGPAGTGKSTFISIAESVFPPSSVTHVSPHQFADDNHLLRLAPARLNTVTETDETKPLGGFANFKRVGSGEEIGVCGKWKEAGVVKPQAAHLFAVNDLPSIPGAPASLWARIHVLGIERPFRGTETCKLGIAKQIIKEEKRAVLAWALNAGIAALRRGSFTLAPSSKQKADEWRGVADNVGEFVKESCEILPPIAAPKFATPLKLAYETYIARCASTGNKPCTKGEFSRRLENLGITKAKSGQMKVWLRCFSPEEIEARQKEEQDLIETTDSYFEATDANLCANRVRNGTSTLSIPKEQLPLPRPIDIAQLEAERNAFYEALLAERQENERLRKAAGATRAPSPSAFLHDRSR